MNGYKTPAPCGSETVIKHCVSDRYAERSKTHAAKVAKNYLNNSAKRLTPAEWCECMAINKFAYTVGICFAILPQSPANGFLDKKFFGVGALFYIMV